MYIAKTITVISVITFLEYLLVNSKLIRLEETRCRTQQRSFVKYVVYLITQFHVSVCMYVCMCVCVHVCMGACVHVCMCACEHVCMCARVSVCIQRKLISNFSNKIYLFSPLNKICLT